LKTEDTFVDVPNGHVFTRTWTPSDARWQGERDKPVPADLERQFNPLWGGNSLPALKTM